MTECKYTHDTFMKARENFKKSVEKDHAKKFEKLKSPDNQDTIIAAVDLAYIDAQRRMHGIDAKERDDAKFDITKEFMEYFKNNAPTEEEFNNYHMDLCKSWIKHFKNDSLRAYGKAQKIVNMTFKYLYCCTNIDNFENHFKYCHMPLDSFTLEWCKRNIQEIDPNKIGSWSKMKDEKSDTYKESKNIEKYSYHYYVARIRDYVAINKIELTPLQLEFIIWPKMQLELATENYLFTLTDEYKKTSEKEKLRKESLEDKMALVVNTINNFNCKKQ